MSIIVEDDFQESDYYILEIIQGNEFIEKELKKKPASKINDKKLKKK